MSEDFPRGGFTTVPKLEAKKTGQKRKRSELETVSDPAVDAKKGQKRKFEDTFDKKQKLKAKKINKDEEKKTFQDIVTPEMLVLGCVCEIHDYEVIVCLPNGQKGCVSITDINNEYTALLKRLTTGDLSQIEPDQDLLSLHDIFRIGSIVRCRVVEVEVVGKRKNVKLTLNPKIVNRDINFLKTGMVLAGCVSSCEDHGFVIDLGVTGITAFLTMAEARKYTDFLVRDEDEPCRLSVGSYIHCMISGDNHMELVVGESRSVSVVVDPRRVHRSLVNEAMKFTLDTLQPGMVSSASITKVTDEALTVKFLNYNGVVQRLHMESSPHKYKAQQQIKVAILYINPVTKAILLTELSHIVTPDLAPLKLFGSIAIGDVIDEAEVVRVHKPYGVYCKLPDRMRAFAKKSQISDKEIDLNTFAKGSKIKCRVVDFDYLDRIVQVSLKRSVIKQPFFSYKDIKPGQVIKCTVEKFKEGGITVKVYGRIHGLIPVMHLSDVPMTNPEKRFKPGKSLKCKVLTIDAEHARLTLTNKQSLVNSKYPVPTDYSEMRRGQTLEGFVASMKPTGVLVVFYNNIKGWIPREELSYAPVESLASMFFPGQVIKCQVKKCDPETEKLILTLKLKKGEPKNVPEDFAVGQLFSCTVKTLESAGLQVLLSNGVEAFLPTVHLSDHHSNCELLLRTFQEGDTIEEVMVINRENIMVTMKQTLIRGYDRNVRDVKDLKPGMILTGFAKKKVSYGLFVETNGLVGLVLNKDVLDHQNPDPVSLVQEGQSLFCKVKEVDLEKNRFLLSLRMSEVYSGDTTVGIDLLADFLSQKRRLMEKLKGSTSEFSKLGELSVGEVTKILVTKVTEQGILCELENGVKGFVTLDNMPGIICKVGDSCTGVVLLVDGQCAQLTLSKEVVKAVQNFKDNKFSKAQIGQIIKAEVHLITKDYVLALLKGHAAGRLVYLPAKRHLNDFLERFQYNVGQVNPVVIKRSVDDNILSSLQIHEGHSASNTEDGKKNKTGSLPKIGSVHTARVRKVCDVQLNISVEGHPGRVHITEIIDHIDVTGRNPLAKFSEGSEIQVKVIAFRNKANEYLPITKTKLKNNLIECSMRPSKFSQTVVNKDDFVNVGEKINAYVLKINENCIQMQLTRSIKGQLHILNAANDIKILSHPEKYFKLGGCHTVTVLRQNGHADFEVSLIDRSELTAGDIVPAKVLKVEEHRGVLLQLPLHQIGSAELTDLDKPIGKYTENMFLTARLVKLIAGPRQKWSVSFRKLSKEKTNSPMKKQKTEIPIVEDVKQAAEETDCNKVAPCLELSSGFSWDDDNALINEPENCDQTNDGTSTVKAVKRLKQLDSEQAERNELDRLVLQNPNSSIAWLRYVSFELERNAVEKARLVAERALKTISFREEQEKLNVWIGYLNLENVYGTPESMQKIVERAQQYNDAFKVFMHLKDIYFESGNLEAAIKTCNMIIKRFKTRPDAWIAFGLILYKSGKFEDARNILDRCVHQLEKKDHLDTIAKFATMEFKYGSGERGETMFENIISNYPKRTDMWSVYIDLCIKHGQIEQARKILERATSLKINPKKLKFLFKKYLQFEEQHGTAEAVQEIKLKAETYVNSSDA